MSQSPFCLVAWVELGRSIFGGLLNENLIATAALLACIEGAPANGTPVRASVVTGVGFASYPAGIA